MTAAGTGLKDATNLLLVVAVGLDVVVEVSADWRRLWH